MGTELVVPVSAEAARSLSSRDLYVLEQVAEIAREILDARVTEWTAAGWTQQRIADEVGCSHQAVSKRQSRLGVKPSQPHAEKLQPVASSKTEVVDADEVLPPEQAGWIELPTDERVIKRLSATAEVNQDRAFEIWRIVLERYGADATVEQVAEVAAELEGDAPTAEGVDVARDAKRCATAVSKAVRNQDPKAAKQALAIWRATVYRELDRLAKSA